jgi:hypothetical protein
MRPLTVVIFISRPQETDELENILKRFTGNKVYLICSTPEAQTELTKRKINFIDSSKYYPNDLQISSWKKRVLEIGNRWYKISGLAEELEFEKINLGRSTELGFHLYLSEVIHSTLTAQNLFDTIFPDIVFCNQNWPESPFRRYQTEALNLESLSLWSLAISRRIKVFHLGPVSTMENRQMLFLRTISGSILSSIRNVNYKFPNLPVVVLGNHYQLKNLEPTLIEFIKGKVSFFVTGKTSILHQSMLKEKNIPFFPFESGTSTWHIIKFLCVWREYKSRLEKFFFSFHPLIWNFIEPKLWWYFINEFPSLSLIVKKGQNVFGSNAQTFITMATADHFSRTLSLVAKSKKITVIELQHGLYLTDVEYPFRDNNYFLVWSKSQRNQLCDGKDNPAKYPIAGYPWFDQYKVIKTLKNKNINVITILVLANFPRDLDDDRLGVSGTPFQFMIKIFTAISSLEKPIKIIFRPHPSCQAKWVIPLAKHYGITFEYDNRSTPLLQAISKSDFVVANFTTAVVDAMFVGKPIFLYTFHNSLKKQVENFDATKLGAWKLFHSGNELMNLINKNYKEKTFVISMLSAQRKFLNEQVVIKSQSAAKQIVDFAKNLIK